MKTLELEGFKPRNGKHWKHIYCLKASNLEMVKTLYQNKTYTNETTYPVTQLFGLTVLEPPFFEWSFSESPILEQASFCADNYGALYSFSSYDLQARQSVIVYLHAAHKLLQHW